MALTKFSYKPTKPTPSQLFSMHEKLRNVLFPSNILPQTELKPGAAPLTPQEGYYRSNILGMAEVPSPFGIKPKTKFGIAKTQ